MERNPLETDLLLALDRLIREFGKEHGLKPMEVLDVLKEVIPTFLPHRE